MIVNEDTEGINVSELLSLLDPSVGDTSHGSLGLPCVLDCVIHRIIEETSDVILIVTNVSWISIEALSHLEDACGLSEFAPEILGNLWDCVDSNTVKVVSFN